MEGKTRPITPGVRGFESLRATCTSTRLSFRFFSEVDPAAQHSCEPTLDGVAAGDVEDGEAERGLLPK